jgi:hypothetical protein
MVGGILAVAASFLRLSSVQRGATYAETILPATLLWGLGIGLKVTPLTAAVLAAVTDDALGQASALNNAASRVGGVILIALVPALIGATAGYSLAGALAHGYLPIRRRRPRRALVAVDHHHLAAVPPRGDCPLAEGVLAGTGLRVGEPPGEGLTGGCTGRRHATGASRSPCERTRDSSLNPPRQTGPCRRAKRPVPRSPPRGHGQHSCREQRRCRVRHGSRQRPPGAPGRRGRVRSRRAPHPVPAGDELRPRPSHRCVGRPQVGWDVVNATVGTVQALCAQAQVVELPEHSGVVGGGADEDPTAVLEQLLALSRGGLEATRISAPTGGRPKDVRVLSALYRHQASRSEGR